jgi:hypothetical protein
VTARWWTTNARSTTTAPWSTTGTPAERDGDARTPTAGGLVGGTEAMHSMRARQRERFGGFNWGAAFFGWLVAVGVAALWWACSPAPARRSA